MKKSLSVIALCLLLCVSARAQVFILNDNIFQGRMSEIKTTVLDSLTNEPVGFASVYVIPSRDTTITNFTLTDAKGEAKLDEVPYGSYVFRVENPLETDPGIWLDPKKLDTNNGGLCTRNIRLKRS